MSDQIISSVVTVLVAIVGVATLAVLVSGRSQTANVIGATGRAFSDALGTAVSPVTGGSLLSNSSFTGGGAFYPSIG